jgi:hypothetical protein
MQFLIADWAEEEKVALGHILGRLNGALLENGRMTKELG